MTAIASASGKPLRLWPGVAAATLLVLLKFVVPRVLPDAGTVAMVGGLGTALLIFLWWLFFSRAAWVERLGAVALMVVALAITRPFLHESIAGAGMGMLFFIYGLQGLSVAIVLWAVAAREHAAGVRRASLVATILIASGAWALVRTGGITGEGDSELHWRWTTTAEERLLAEGGGSPAPARSASAPTTPSASTPAPEPLPVPEAVKVGAARASADPVPPAPPPAKRPDEADPVPASPWPGFRGPRRDSVVHGIRIDTDWSRNPPAEVWRQPVGPGWSSFAVGGDFIYTQEQRGEYEVVSSYRLSTGDPVWMHRDPVRFYESNGGPGPRATPALAGGRIYTLGATGVLNALDASTGALAWSRDAAADTGVKIPDWGFAGSPLITGDLVVVALAGQLAAYSAASGEPRWTGPTGGAGYSSPHLATLEGVDQIVLLRGSRTISVSPADGTVLWEHVWQPGASIVQPAIVGRTDVLINTADAMGGQGMRRLTVTRGAGGWSVNERWTSRGLKPYFNDFVVHEGHAYGFDGSILSVIDIETGERRWKGGRYGHGQMILLAEQDLLLVLSEQGEIALVSARPDGFAEVARMPALDEKTWNHPVLAGDLLLVRNGEEMVAFRLPLVR